MNILVNCGFNYDGMRINYVPFCFPKSHFPFRSCTRKAAFVFLYEARDIKQQCSQENTLKEKVFDFSG